MMYIMKNVVQCEMHLELPGEWYDHQVTLIQLT